MLESQSRPAIITKPPQSVVFICVHNSARSQMAEAFARAMAPPAAEVWSAGVRPSGVHPLAIQVMNEVGIDLSGQRSKHVDDVPWQTVDTVVSLCSEMDEECPVVPETTRRVRWPLPDPGQAPEPKRLEAFREVRDEIRWRVSSLWPHGD